MGGKELEKSSSEGSKNLIDFVREAADKKKEREKSIKLREYLVSLENGKVARPKNAYDIVYAPIINSSFGEPQELMSGDYNYPFFSGRDDEYAVYGLHGSLNEIVEFLRVGKETGGKKKGILLVGESGAGKSLIVEAIKKGFVEHTKSMKDPFYAVRGCPIQEDPLNLLEPFCDEKKKKELKEKGDIELVEPCPCCQSNLKSNGYNLEEMEVVPIEFSSSQGLGIVKIDPKLTRERTPESMKLINEMMLRSNRGVLEISELFQHSLEFLTSLNDLVRGRNVIYNGRQYHLDNVIIAHTTTGELEDKKKGKEYESLLKRFEIIRIPFNLSSMAEANIYIKTLKESKFPFFEKEKEKKIPDSMHISTRTFNVFSEFAVLSRQNKNPASSESFTYDKKLKYYNGEEAEGIPNSQAKEYEKKEAEAGEGFNGIPPAFMENIVTTIASDTKEKGCLNPFTAASMLKKRMTEIADSEKSELSTSPIKEKDEKRKEINERQDRYNNFFGIIEANNERWLVDAIKKGFRSDYEEACEKEYDRYVMNCVLFCGKAKKENPQTGESELIADTKHLEQIEKKAFEGKVVSENETRERREKIALKFSSGALHGKKSRYEDAEGWLKRGIDGSLFATADEMNEVLSYISKQIPPDQKTDEDIKKYEKLFELKRNLMENYGFCDNCFSSLLKYAKEKDLLKKSQSRSSTYS